MAPRGFHTVTGPFYKALRADCSSYQDGEGLWPAPSQRGPGAWTRVPDAKPVAGSGGLALHHLSGLPNALGTRLFIAEAEDIVAVTEFGVIAGRARLLRPIAVWDAQAARHFAADCAEQVLDALDWHATDDDRPGAAIAVARDFADGLVSLDTMYRTWADVHTLARGHTCDIPCPEAWQAAWTAFDALLELDPGDAARIAVQMAHESAVLAASWWAGWKARMDAAWTACTAARVEELREAAARAASEQADADVRRWQAGRLEQYLHGWTDRAAAAPEQALHRG